MIIDRGSDLIIKLNLRDDNGNVLRVADKPSFEINIFTTDKNQYLQYGKADITISADSDELYLPSDQLEVLDSGVIAYTYYWGIADSGFGDNEYNRKHTVYTDYYFRNVGNTTQPSNPITHQTIQQIKNSIADEVLRATSVENSLSQRIDAHTVTVKDNALIITTYNG